VSLPAGRGAGAGRNPDGQPVSRFWEFQAIETGIFLALTAILLYLAIRRIRRIS